MKVWFLKAWDKLVNFLKKSLYVIIPLLVLFGCGFITRAWWIALGETLQQIILGIVGVGFLYYCILPIIVLSVIIGVVIWANWNRF